MNATKQELLDCVDRDRDLLIQFLQEFVRCRSPNPPGDTRDAAGHVCRLLDAHGLAYRLIAPEPTMPNIVASFESGRPGRHLALNGHLDVFPVEDESGWTHAPWSGGLVDGKIYGRG